MMCDIRCLKSDGFRHAVQDLLQFRFSYHHMYHTQHANKANMNDVNDEKKNCHFIFVDVRTFLCLVSHLKRLRAAQCKHITSNDEMYQYRSIISLISIILKLRRRCVLVLSCSMLWNSYYKIIYEFNIYVMLKSISTEFSGAEEILSPKSMHM